MKKLYEEPNFELNKFSFEDILKDGYVDNSDPEDNEGTGGGDMGEDPFEGL